MLVQTPVLIKVTVPRRYHLSITCPHQQMWRSSANLEVVPGPAACPCPTQACLRGDPCPAPGIQCGHDYYSMINHNYPCNKHASCLDSDPRHKKMHPRTKFKKLNMIFEDGAARRATEEDPPVWFRERCRTRRCLTMADLPIPSAFITPLRCQAMRLACHNPGSPCPCF